MTNPKEEIRYLISLDQTQLGETFRLIESGITKPLELVAKSSVANTGVISHHKYIINAILEGKVETKSSNLATYARRAIDRLLAGSGADSLSKEALSLLQERRLKLLGIISDEEAISNDTRKLLSDSSKLESELARIGEAIYVYTFPTYYRAGVDGDTEVRWLKIGLTTKSVWQRIIDQNRQTSMPEDPVLIRVYHKKGIDLRSVEAKLMETLLRVQFEQSAARHTKAGKEWFATHEDSIDAIAELIGLTILKFDFESL